MTAIDEREPDARVGLQRLAVGLVQGLAAAALIESATGFGKAHAPTFAALVIVAAFPPLIALGGLGRMRAKTLLAWCASAAVVLAGLAAYDLWRQPLQAYADAARVWPSPQFLFFAAVAVFIAHHLIEPADVERRLLASYAGRFEIASRHAFQLVLSAAFTLVLWGVLNLGAALFELIGVKLLQDLLTEPWFTAPIAAVAFAAAVHLTDVRPGLIRGVRAVGLMLLSWLLPLMAALTAAFLVTLLFTGVQPLWATRRAASLMLSAAAVLVVLVNAVYQDGQDAAERPAALRWSVRAAALLLIPLVVLAGWANALRIHQYGLTPERIAAVFVLAVAAVFAGGYAWAAVARRPWMRRLEAVNVTAAVVALVAILAVFSPVVDPARLSVVDQLRRLEAGRVKADAFDFRFLQTGAGRFGREALARLTASRDPVVADRARRAARGEEPVVAGDGAGPPLSRATILPTPDALPQSFRTQGFSRNEIGAFSTCLIGGDACVIRTLDAAGDSAAEVLVAQGMGIDVYALRDNRWLRIGQFGGSGCAPTNLGGSVRTVPAEASDLEIDGRRFAFQAMDRCEPAPRPSPPAPSTPPSPPPQGLGPAFNR